MVRFKQRYILVKMHTDARDVQQKAIYQALSGRVVSQLGVWGYGAVRATLNIKYHNPDTNMFIVRVTRDFVRDMWFCISSVKELNGRPTTFEVVHVGGTLRTCKKALLLVHRRQHALGQL